MIERRQSGAARPGESDGWRELFCCCDWCSATRWLVRADPRAPELWQLAADESQAPWSVAASAPICPRCGEELSAHVEGLGEPEVATDNPFVGYIRTLKAAA
jgi:hypothetical protein